MHSGRLGLQVTSSLYCQASNPTEPDREASQTVATSQVSGSFSGESIDLSINLHVYLMRIIDKYLLHKNVYYGLALQDYSRLKMNNIYHSG